MASYRDYDYEPSGFEHRSPRGSDYRHNLEFLNGFETSSKSNQMEQKHFDEKMLYRRGITYTVILSLAWFYIFRYWQRNLVVTSILFLVAFSIEDVRSALYTVWFPVSTPATTALERRSSSVPADYAPGNQATMRRRNRNVAHRATVTSHNDPYYGLHPDNQPRRLWHESLNDAWPHITEDVVAGLQLLPYFLGNMLLFHVVFQVLTTLMQTLGVHFRVGHDDIGLFPRAWTNLFSTQNLFGIGGLAQVGRNWAHLARWAWGYIVVAPSKFWRFLMSTEIVPGSDWPKDKLEQAGIKPEALSNFLSASKVY